MTIIPMMHKNTDISQLVNPKIVCVLIFSRTRMHIGVDSAVPNRRNRLALNFSESLNLNPIIYL